MTPLNLTDFVFFPFKLKIIIVKFKVMYIKPDAHSYERRLLLLELTTLLDYVLFPSLEKRALHVVEEGAHGHLRPFFFEVLGHVVSQEAVLLHDDVAGDIQGPNHAFRPEALCFELLLRERHEVLDYIRGHPRLTQGLLLFPLF